MSTSGPSPLQAALIALAQTTPGTAEFAAAAEHVATLRAERPEREQFAKTVPCAFGTCSRLFASDKGATGHSSGPKRLDNGDPNPDFCQGAADYQAGARLAKRTTW